MARTTKQQRRAVRKARRDRPPRVTFERSGNPARRRAFWPRECDGYEEIVCGDYRLRGLTADLTDGEVELIFVAPLRKDQWSVIDQGVNGPADPLHCVAALLTPEGCDLTRVQLAMFGASWDVIEDDPVHVSQVQARGSNTLMRAMVAAECARDERDAAFVLARYSDAELAEMRNGLSTPADLLDTASP